MKEEIPIVLKDSKYIKHIIVQLNLKNNTSLIFSEFSAWENLALIMEALAVTVQKCIQEGIDRKKVYTAVKNYLVKILGSYETTK